MKTDFSFPRFLLRILAVGALALSLSSSLPASSIRMTFVNVNGTQAFGQYVGPYTGTMNGAPVDLFCMDFANHVNFGQQWEANLTPITAGSDLGNTRYGSLPGALDLYQEAAWLTLQYSSQPASEFGDIHATMWRLFGTGGPDPGSSWWLNEALSHYKSFDYNDFRVVTNIGPVQPAGQVQEFLIRLPPSAVPEPGTQLLVGFVVAGAGCICRRLRLRRPI